MSAPSLASQCLRQNSSAAWMPRCARIPARNPNSSIRQYAITHRPITRQRINFSQYGHHQRRKIGGIPFTGSVKENIRILIRHHPFAVPLVFGGMVAMFGIILYIQYFYLFEDMPRYANYPEPVIKYLRRAVFYTINELDVEKALDNYAKALAAAKEAGMDAYSDEVLGIRFKQAQVYEQAHNIPIAIRILEVIRGELISQSEQALSYPDDILSPDERRKRRSRLLAKAVGTSLKLAELYTNPFIHRDAAALDITLWAVNTCLREGSAPSHLSNSSASTFPSTAPSPNPLDPETTSDWLAPDAFGATLEALAHQYESRNIHFLAAPLFLQALALKSATDCHSITLMNNLSISLAQQVPPPEPGVPPPSRESLVQSGVEWAERAIRMAGEIEGEQRTEECDEACAVAMHNLGEFREMLGDREGAAGMYRKARGLAKKIGFGEGMVQSEASLKRLAERDAVRN